MTNPEQGSSDDLLTGSIDEDDLTVTPIDTQTVTINPKVDEEPLDLCCPDCGAVIQGTADRDVVEYRCDCDELRKYRIRGDADE